MKWRTPKTSERALFRERRIKPFVRGSNVESEHPRYSVSVVVLWGVFLGVGLYAVLSFPEFLVEGVEVEGNRVLPREDIERVMTRELSGRNALHLARNSFFLVSEAKLESVLLREFPALKSADVQTIFPQTVRVAVEEWPFLLFYCSGGPCALLDGAGGAQFSESALQETALPHYFLIDESSKPFSPRERVIDESFRVWLEDLVGGLASRFSLSIDASIALPHRFADDVRVAVSPRYMLFLSPNVPAEETLALLGAVLEKDIPQSKVQDLSYIDLRAPGKVFYRYRDKESVERAEDKK